MRHVNLKFIGRDLLIGLITASFVYAPTAFAKPNNRAKKRPVPYAKMLKLTKKRGPKTMSELSDAAKPMFRKRGYKLFTKDIMRSWDTKIDKMVVGRNYFKFKSEGRVYFGRYVDRGPVAFILNNKPILWKDVLFYNKLRSRIYNITTGRKLRKVSYLEDFISYFSKEVYGQVDKTPGTSGNQPPADEDNSVLVISPVTPIVEQETVGGGTAPVPQATPSSGGKATACISLEEMKRFNASVRTELNGMKCPRDLQKNCPTPEGFNGGVNVICSKNFSECASSNIRFVPGTADPDCNPDKESCNYGGYRRGDLIACNNIPPVPAADDKKPNWGVIAIIAMLFLFLMAKRRKGKSKPKPTPPGKPEPPAKPEPPKPSYAKGGETTCPPVGSRGITQKERDNLEGCKSSCVDSKSCASSHSGKTVD